MTLHEPVRDGPRSQPLYRSRACDGSVNNKETTIDQIAVHRVPLEDSLKRKRRVQTMSKVSKNPLNLNSVFAER